MTASVLGFRLLGREGNLFFRADGSLVSPTDVDAALTEVAGDDVKEGIDIIVGAAQPQSSAPKPAAAPPGPRMF